MIKARLQRENSQYQFTQSTIDHNEKMTRQEKLNPKNLPNRPPPLVIPQNDTFIPNQKFINGPHTARKPLETDNSKKRQNFTNSTNVTPSKKQKDSSFSYFTKAKKEMRETVDSCAMKQIREKMLKNKENFNKSVTQITAISKFNQLMEKQNISKFRETINTPIAAKKNQSFQEYYNTDKKKQSQKQDSDSSPLFLKMKKNKSYKQENRAKKHLKTVSDFNSLNNPMEKLNFKKSMVEKNQKQKSKRSFVNLANISQEKSTRTSRTPIKTKDSQLLKNTSIHKIPQNLPRTPQKKATQKIMSQTDPYGSFFTQATLKKQRRSYRLPTKNQKEMCLDDFTLGSCKGQGRFGKVFPARHKKTGFLIAIKEIKKESLKYMVEQFTQELKISLFADHPNIVKMFGFFDDKQNIYIMMEYMQEGNLYKLIKMNKKLSQDLTAQRLLEICEALKILHQNQIFHRDIKPENIVLSNGIAKLCDFGWAVCSNQRRKTYCGTLDYVCPEILEGEEYDNFVDIWAIGVLAYEMIMGKTPFYNISRKQTMKNIMKCDFVFPKQMSSSAKRFIMKALKKDPQERFTIETLLQDSFISKWRNR